MRAVDGAGAATWYAYDALGNLSSRTTGGITERYAYDAAGNLASYADGNGHRTTYAYDATGRLTATTDALGQTTSIGYDAVGNATSLTDARGHETRLAYDAAGNLTGQVDRLGQATSYAYDAEGRLAQVVAPTGAVTSYARDALGNVTEATDALGRMTSYGYDELDALTSITSPSGAVESFERDVAGRLTAATEAAGSTVRYGYDAAGGLTSKSYDADSSQDVSYALDALGLASARDDAVGTATYERDGLGRVVSETDALGRTLSYAYDDRGNLESIGYPDGSTVRYGYDRADNLVLVTAPEGEYRYAYDAADRPVSLARPNGTATAFSYDAEGNVARVETTGSSGALISRYAYAYDAEGRIASEEALTTDGAGDEHRMARAFSYDGEGRLVAVEASGTEGIYAEAYAYDAAGNRTSLIRTGDGADEVAYAYDADDRLVREESAAHGTTTYAYDAAGQMTSKRADGQGETTYEYSVEGRLAAVKAGGRTLMAAAYDGDGNRVMQASPYHEQVPGAEGSAEGATAPGADAGQEGVSLWSLGLFWYGFAAEGAALLASANPAVMVGAVETACGLIEATWPEGALDPDAADYALAHLGLPAFDLAAMTGAYGVSDGEPATTAELLDVVTYTNSSVIGEVSQVAFSHSTRSGESTEAYGLERLSKDGTSYAYDGRGSVSQTLSASGAVASWQMWGSFGEQEAGSALGELPSYGYNAEESHPQTGLQYLRARYYDASTGRFGVQDSYLGQTTDPLTLNRYLYCLSDPLNWLDPDGHITSRLGSSRTVSRGTRTLVNRSGIKTSLQAHYERTGATISAAINAAGSVLNYLGNIDLRRAVSSLSRFSASTVGASRSSSAYRQLMAARIRAQVVNYNCGTASHIDAMPEAPRATIPDFIHTGLDGLGFVPIAGAIPDALNSVLYLADGNLVDAALSLAAAIPIAGDAIAGANAARKGYKYVTNLDEAISFADLKHPVIDGELVGSAYQKVIVDPDPYHAFPKLVDYHIDSATHFLWKNGDGTVVDLYQLEGAYNGKNGVYEWIVDQDGNVSHRLFVEGGTVSGRPNGK